jgi:hypothetical protein
MRHAAIIVFALTLASPSQAGVAQEYGFDAWPGKGGALRQGVALWEVSLPAHEVHSRRDRLSTSGEVIVRFEDRGGNTPVFEVALRVFDSVHEAQSHLLTYLDTCTLHLPLAKTLGLDIGDVAFATMDGEVLDNVAFTRSNVYVRVTLLSSTGSSPGPLVSDTARKIDQNVESQKQALSPAGLSKPVISKLGPSLTTSPDTPTEIQLEATDPLGGALEYHLDEAGAMIWQENGRWLFMAEKPLAYTVTLHVLNEHFLMASRSVTITVQE